MAGRIRPWWRPPVLGHDTHVRSAAATSALELGGEPAADGGGGGGEEGHTLRQRQIYGSAAHETHLQQDDEQGHEAIQTLRVPGSTCKIRHLVPCRDPR